MFVASLMQHTRISRLERCYWKDVASWWHAEGRVSEHMLHPSQCCNKPCQWDRAQFQGRRIVTVASQVTVATVLIWKKAFWLQFASQIYSTKMDIAVYRSKGWATNEYGSKGQATEVFIPSIAGLINSNALWRFPLFLYSTLRVTRRNIQSIVAPYHYTKL